MIKIGIVDDHAIVRSGLRQFFSEHVDLRVVGEAASGREAIELVRTTELDVLVMRVSLPVALSFAVTFRTPFASMSKVTSICGIPRGAGGIPPSLNLPSVRFCPAIGRSPCST